MLVASRHLLPSRNWHKRAQSATNLRILNANQFAGAYYMYLKIDSFSDENNDR